MQKHKKYKLYISTLERFQYPFIHQAHIHVHALPLFGTLMQIYVHQQWVLVWQVSECILRDPQCFEYKSIWS